VQIGVSWRYAFDIGRWRPVQVIPIFGSDAGVEGTAHQHERGTRKTYRDVQPMPVHSTVSSDDLGLRQ
jgi:hypothetical protein